MLCPEVWKFNSPKNSVNVCTGHVASFNHCDHLIKRHYYNHSVSVVIPDCPKIPEDLVKNLKDDCDYYKVVLPVSQLIEKDFIDLFVLSGELTALSIGTRIDVDDCACVTPTGNLLLSVTRETYQQLGLEGVPWEAAAAIPERYAVTIDLKRSCFKPGKPNYDRVYKSLTQFVPLKFNFIIAWEPPEGSHICPSSIAKFLDCKGHDVRVCSPVFSYKTEKNIIVPSTKLSEPDELIEWLGAFSLGAFRKDNTLSSASLEYLSSYLPPYGSENKSQVILFHWTGFFTHRKIAQLFSKLRDYIQAEDRSNMPWISLNVIGFADAPVSWDSNHNVYGTNGDNHYTIFLNPDKYLVTYKVTASNSKKPKKWTYGTLVK